MSTRSFVAEPYGDSWRGRYCHSDGYPSWNGRVLRELVLRDGVEAVRQRILHDRYGWSSIDPREGKTLHEMYQTGRLVLEPGYGIAYTTQTTQSNPDEWITPERSEWDTEWGYILGDSSLFIMRPTYLFSQDSDWRIVCEVRYDDAAPDWEQIEEKIYANEG